MTNDYLTRHIKENTLHTNPIKNPDLLRNFQLLKNNPDFIKFLDITFTEFTPHNSLIAKNTRKFPEYISYDLESFFLFVQELYKNT